MNNSRKCFYFLMFLFFCIACANNDQEKQLTPNSLLKGTYGYDADFLRKHTGQIIELKSEDGNAKILLSPGYQGRVMTSTAEGDSGTSYGMDKL